ncbi:phospholipase A [Aestuariibacter salexigens]|uniref:phospholipase A n=1 Tax=Aestuariibacter salexigens TaxID=226010 RepID=UPI00040F18F8|nr:phospholipase A [Aestuariibacter salexigens]
MRNVTTATFTLAMASAMTLMPCASIAQQQTATSAEADETAQTEVKSIFDERKAKEKSAVDNPFSITQHRRNYILPLSHIKNPNPIGVTELDEENVDNLEAKYQISVKLPVYLEGNDDSGLYVGFTAVSYWQLYNSEVSKPFRETNYEPEIFYAWRNDFSALGLKFNEFRFGFNHQSNGQSGLKSRSWNRLFASVLFSDDDDFYYAKAWYRIPEDDKLNPLDPDGDDNPDITDFIGHAEIGYGTRVGNVDLLLLLTNNFDFSDNRGGVEVSLSYPLTQRYDILLQYFNGYGDSLIDYNRHQERIGIGIQLKFL